MGLITYATTGASCSGSDGDPNRVLTLPNVALTQANGFQVHKNGSLLTLTTDYTVSHNATSSTVTFIAALLNTAQLNVLFIEGSTPATAYCNYTDVYNKTGLSTTEVASAIVDVLIDDTTAEINSITGRNFTNANAVTEYLSIKDKDLIGNYQTSIQLSKYPIQSITLFNQLDIDGNATDTYALLTSVQIAAGTYETVDYWLETNRDSTTNLVVPNGKIGLKTDSFPKGTNNVKVSYTYGYTTVPIIIRDLATCLAGIRCWIRFLGGCYNRLNSYSIPQQNVNKGDFYQRGQQNINLLQEEANRLLDLIGRKPRTLFFSTGAVR